MVVCFSTVHQFVDKVLVCGQVFLIDDRAVRTQLRCVEYFVDHFILQVLEDVASVGKDFFDSVRSVEYVSKLIFGSRQQPRPENKSAQTDSESVLE